MTYLTAYLILVLIFCQGFRINPRDDDDANH